MKVEISGLDERGFTRALAQLDDAGITYSASPRRVLTCDSDDPEAIKNFVRVALTDPNARVFRAR
jgi:hypothetical protein